MLALMAVLRFADLRFERDELLNAGELRASSLALMTSGYLGEMFASADASLRQLTLHSRRIGGPTAPARSWMPSLASARAGLASVGAISVVDRDGIIRYSTRADIVGQSRRDDNIVRRAFSSDGDELLVGMPFRTQVPERSMIIPIGRRLTNEAGELDGAVVASFIPTLPQRFFRNVNVGGRGTIWVFHPDGEVLFREPSETDPTGQSARDNAIFRAASRAGGSGTLRAAAEPEGPVLLSAFHSTAVPPLIVAVSLDRNEVLAAWRREAAASTLLFVVATLTLAAMLVILFRQMEARAAVERALAETRRLEAERLRDAHDRLAVALEREQGARQDAERASALKDEFLMMVSHELRTPLTAIYGWTRMLVAGGVGEAQREKAIRTIERNARAQARLIDDLLDVSASAGGKLRLDMRMVDVARVIEDAVETVMAAAEAKDIRIATAIDPAAGRVPGDTDRLQQIVWNLLSNAVKFTPDGGRIEVTAVRTPSEVEISVADTGIGISPDFLPQVFDRFRQEDTGTQRRYGGLGLGLAIVRNLAELHGGTVSAHSDGPNRGARFVVRLPAPALPRLVEGRAAMSAAGEARLDGLRALVVDDDPEARALFTTVLEEAGARVTTAASAAEGLTALRRSSYDVMVSDIEMPGVDGYALLREAQAIARERREHLTAVAVTAYSRPEDEARSLNEGFQYHLRKPIDPPALVGAVRAVWAGAPADGP